MRQTILVVHPGALGDVLLARPALAALKASFPAHELGVVAGESVGRLLQACGEVDTVFALEGEVLTGLLAGQASVSQPVRGWLSRCDLVVCWMHDPDGQLRATLQGLRIPRVIVHSLSGFRGLAIHRTDRCMETVEEIAETSSRASALSLPPQVLAQGAARLAAHGISPHDRLVALHPGSGSEHKCCDPSVFAHAIQWLRDRQMAPMLVLGPADEKRGKAVLDACETRPPVLQGADLLTVAGILARTVLFVGHDSGLTHLAAALSIPTVAMFGPTDPDRWVPRGAPITVLRGAPCRCETWESVKTCRGKPCLQITPDKLRDACEPVLRKQLNGWAGFLSAGTPPCSARAVVLDCRN